MTNPNILYIMTDQQRFDTIRALGNEHIYTPNYDRLAARGMVFDNAYSTCPVCVPARYTIRTGCEPLTTRYFSNGATAPAPGQAEGMEERCGPYLARTMGSLGYRTFGIGKFHSSPWDEDLGYDIHLHTEEMFGVGERRVQDSYAGWIAREHPEYAFVEMLHGERTEMYYMPQMSPLPAECTVEAYTADRAVEQLQVEDSRPFFGLVSFVGPHPPCAPPLPYNRLYDPDRMPDPVLGDPAVDHQDDQIPCMNYHIWAEDVNTPHARVLKSRYYGEITYIDACLGRILDAVEARGDADNTLICFFADHGDHLGDHHGWQKESFFEASCRVPFLLSWPSRLAAGERRHELVCLTDLFGLATGAAGALDTREGTDLLGMLDGTSPSRDMLFGYYGAPGTSRFKVMVRSGPWKYIFLANGGMHQLFNVDDDPQEHAECSAEHPDVVERFHTAAVERLRAPGGHGTLDADHIRTFPHEHYKRVRVYQHNRSYSFHGFPEKPEELLKEHFGQ